MGTGWRCPGAARFAWSCRSGPRSPRWPRSAAAGSRPAAPRARTAAARSSCSAAKGQYPPLPASRARSVGERCSSSRTARCQGLAWLEGQRRPLARGPLRALERPALGGARARSPRPGPGSQMALAGAVLADGSWLLAWSAYDGDGRRDRLEPAASRAGALEPGRAAVAAGNAVPDITPALAAARRRRARSPGAATTARTTGCDRARFDGRAWKDERRRPLRPARSIPRSRRSVPPLSDARPGAWSVLSWTRRARSGAGRRALRPDGAAGDLRRGRGRLRLRWLAGQ